MLHTIGNAFLSVAVSPLGAQLQSIRSGDGTEYLWQGDSRYWSDRALNLFPYVARLTEGCYYLDGDLYRMDIHGIAPYRHFRLVENTGERLVLGLMWDAQTYIQYPRRFDFRVVYALVGKCLEVTFEVENLDEKTMYFGLGGHPGFSVPLEKGKRFEDYRLRFPQAQDPRQVCFTPDCFVTGEQVPFSLEEKMLPLTHSLFDGDAIVLTGAGHQVVLESSGAKAVTVTFPQMDYLGLWHWPKTDAPYLCLEPWCSLPARAGEITVMEKQEDLICLPPRQTYQNRWTIELT